VDGEGDNDSGDEEDEDGRADACGCEEDMREWLDMQQDPENQYDTSEDEVVYVCEACGGAAYVDEEGDGLVCSEYGCDWTGDIPDIYPYSE